MSDFAGFPLALRFLHFGVHVHLDARHLVHAQRSEGVEIPLDDAAPIDRDASGLDAGPPVDSGPPTDSGPLPDLFGAD